MVVILCNLPNIFKMHLMGEGLILDEKINILVQEPTIIRLDIPTVQLIEL